MNVARSVHTEVLHPSDGEPAERAAPVVTWRVDDVTRHRSAGVLVALRPSGATLTAPALIALAGSLFFALLMIATRKGTETGL